MAQMNWTYVADSGQTYRVKMHHGVPSGHVMVAINGKVTIIDFFVKSSKTYTLFLEDEVMVLEIEKGKEGFSYGFKIDEQADTQRNRERKRVTFRQNSSIALVSILVIGLFVWLVLWFQNVQENTIARQSIPKLDEVGTATWARYGLEKDKPVVFYSYGKQIITLPLEEWPEQLSSLEYGDDVRVLHLPQKPRIARIEPQQPGPHRSKRLLLAWLRLPESQPENPDPACIAGVILSDSTLLFNTSMPWHLSSRASWPIWIADSSQLPQQIKHDCLISNLN